MEKYETAIEKLEIAAKKSSNPNIFILMGNNYRKMTMFEKAKNCYLNAIYSVPSRLYPKYLMVQLLVEMDQKMEAYVWANEILITKEKVSTNTAKIIKEEMESFLKNGILNSKK